MLQHIWQYIQPPTGRQARRAIGLIMASMSLARLGYGSYLVPSRMLASFWYGVALMSVGLALVLTARTRLRWWGRVVAIAAVVVCAALAFDTSLHTAPGISLLIITYAMLGEAGSRHEC